MKKETFKTWAYPEHKRAASDFALQQREAYREGNKKEAKKLNLKRDFHIKLALEKKVK